MRGKTRLLALAIVATATAAIAGWASIEVAGQVQPLPVVTYNGCIAAEGGTFYSFGPEAVVECEEGDTPASVSSGDVTEVAGGEGLTGGAKDGPATLDIAPGYRLPQDCGQGDSIAHEGEEWGCLAPLDPSAFAKSDQTCPPGSVASGIDILGKLVCVGQAQMGGPSTDWTGVVTNLRTARTELTTLVVNITLYNPNLDPTQATARAFDEDGRELRMVRINGVGDCVDMPIPPGGTRECAAVRDHRDAGLRYGAVYVHADLPVLPFGWDGLPRGAFHAEVGWQYDWYPFCPEHVGTCND